MRNWLAFTIAVLSATALGGVRAEQLFREDFAAWSNVKAGTANAAGWIPTNGAQNYQAVTLGERTVLDATANGDPQSSYQGWNWAVRKRLGFTGGSTHLRLEYDFKMVVYVGPAVWVGRSDDNMTVGYGVTFHNDGNSGKVLVDLLKFVDADYAPRGGLGEVIGLWKGVKLDDWLAAEGKVCQLKDWNHVELRIDADSPADPVTRLTLYLNGEPDPVMTIIDTQHALNPARFTHANFAAKGLGGHKIYLDSLVVAAGDAAKPRPALAYDMESLLQAVKPFEHPLGDRFPLLAWNVPVTMEILKDPNLRTRTLQALAARGIVPTLGGMTWRANLTLAKALQELKLPVHLQLYDVPGGEAALYGKAPLAARGPDACLGNKDRDWPCLIKGDPRAVADVLTPLMLAYKKAGVDLAGVWFDYEALPHPWNGAYESQRKCEDCRKLYPAGALDNFRAFQEFIYEYRSKLLSEALVDPVHAVFPKALVGNYSEFASGKDQLWMGWPPRTLGRLSAMMPMTYATTNLVAGAFKDKPITQAVADEMYFRNLLRTVSDSNANKQPGQLSLPYMSRYCPENPDPKYRFGMSSAVYRELIRHLLLRGTDGFYLFNEGYPNGLVSARQSFESVEDVRFAYDELLEYRKFLDHGVPLTYASPKPEERAVWSGLRLKKQCLVRVCALGTERVTLDMPLYPKVKVTVDAPPAGATYLISSSGEVKRLAGGHGG